MNAVFSPPPCPKCRNALLWMEIERSKEFECSNCKAWLRSNYGVPSFVLLALTVPVFFVMSIVGIWGTLAAVFLLVALSIVVPAKLTRVEIVESADGQ